MESEIIKLWLIPKFATKIEILCVHRSICYWTHKRVFGCYLSAKPAEKKLFFILILFLRENVDT